MENVRVLYEEDTREMWSNNKRRLGTRFGIDVHDWKLAVLYYTMERDTFMTICIDDTEENDSHMVSVYRAMDGRYLYYDSAETVVDKSFLQYMQINNIPYQDVTVVDAPNQIYRTCAYHSFVFLDFVTTNYYLNSFDLAEQYRMAGISCPTAVFLVSIMLQEFPNNIDIFTRGDPNIDLIVSE
ncbi:hypothetical protein Hamer_G023074 [Homarus americanus]|uniref:Uncharacterized protein n=1 Tax=Homarus americanus TaxID=6706 RepID=A0A8J5N4R4_HOMAM|nr:hypothetical protein Hamer_G023074 [Homarus americanus]